MWLRVVSKYARYLSCNQQGIFPAMILTTIIMILVLDTTTLKLKKRLSMQYCN
jgi:hypothetical protein